MDQENRYISKILELIRLRTVFQEKDKSEYKKATQFFTKLFKEIGLDNVKDLNTSDSIASIFYGEKIFNKNNPTILIYGHYDVQPAGDITKWDTDPFKPEIKDGKVYGRGATDDKGQLMANLMAIAWYIAEGQHNYNVKVVLEGEEEYGSNSFSELIKNEKAKNELSADILYIADGVWLNKTSPSIEHALRGVSWMELSVKTGEKEVHSGLFGNAVLNAGDLIGYLIYKLKSFKSNKIRIPNIYKNVIKLNEEYVENLEKVPFSWKEVREQTETYTLTPKRVKGKLMHPLILTGYKPSFDIHTVRVGSDKPFTVIPNEGLIIASFRTVPYLSGEELRSLLTKYLEKIIPKGVKWGLKFSEGSPYFYADARNKYLEHLQESILLSFGYKAHLIPSGASIGFVGEYNKIYPNTVIFSVNYGLPDDNCHSPNEKFDIKQFKGGYETMCRFLNEK